jgi:HK97 family phage prohead protease
MTEQRAQWTTAYINDLPDSAFACIDSGGEKDEDGKTVPRSLRHYPHHDDTGKVDEPHLANARARVQQQGTTSCGYSHLFNEHKLPSDEGRSVSVRPPRDNLVRALPRVVELKADEEDPDAMPILEGRLVYDEWAKIDSVWEGRFLERIARGAFTKSFTENRDRLRILFQHGMDQSIGDKPLAPIEELGEDEQGGYYRGRMLDTSYNRDLIPGLKAGLYGSSFRFSVVKEDLERSPKASIFNPDRLPERTVQEAQVLEFGPVTFPAYSGSTAAVRSMTDELITSALVRSPERLRALLESAHIALPPDGAGTDHSDEGSRKVYPSISREAFLERLTSG